MGLFTLDGTGLASSSGDPSSYDGTSVATLFGPSSGVGDLYNYVNTDGNGNPVPAAADSQTLGQLQSGGTGFDWTALSGTLSSAINAAVAVDSLNHGWPLPGQQTTQYRAPNGQVYPVGYGPNTVAPQGNGLMFLLLIGLVVFALAEEKK